MHWEDALHMVQNRRYCISPNGGFLTQIKEYESIYKANVTVSANPGRVISVPRRKRDDEEANEEEDSRREAHRRPIRPLKGAHDTPAPTEPVTYMADTDYDPDAMET
ncbi:phosphatases II [Pyrrhoderma noxium]|uniref:Phosphatases II n=1 Tax=Pyrrhoderma noxium TaxID=2282107 RepID=A0A286UCK9_9AGAM|nr:phosphatases II [Pyrrhoderma noxium]